MCKSDTVRDQIEQWMEKSDKVNVYDTLFDRLVFAVDCYDVQDVYKGLKCEFEDFADIQVVGDVVIMVLH